MKNKTAAIKAAFFYLLTFGIAFFALFATKESEFLLIKVLFFYLILVGVMVFWNILALHGAVNKMSADVTQKYDNLQRLLLDLRDGTKKFFGEKRRALRVKADMLARFVDKVTGDDFVKINEVSATGCRLLTAQPLKTGDIVKLNIHLPFFPQPIFAKIRVVRSRATGETKGTSAVSEVGAEIVEMSDGDADMLLETIDILTKSSHKK